MCEFDTLAQVQSDKATTELTSPYDGTILKIHHAEGDTVKTGHPLLSIDVKDEEQQMPNDNNLNVHQNSPDDAASKPESSKISNRGIIATPKIRKLAESLQIDLKKIIGTGKDGRILESDLPTKNPIQEGHLTAIQRAMFKHMQNSLTIPHFSYSELIDMTELFNAKSKTKISISAYMLKALSKVVDEHPIFNHIIIDENVKKANGGDCIGLAVDTPLGLMVPVISGISSITLAKLSQNLHEDIIVRARRNNLSIHETASKNACITLSNVGAVFADKKEHQISMADEMPANVMPRILHPQVAIVAVTRAIKQQSTGRIVGRTCWSADHRIIDGVTLANASSTFKMLLENPQLLALNKKPQKYFLMKGMCPNIRSFHLATNGLRSIFLPKSRWRLSSTLSINDENVGDKLEEIPESKQVLEPAQFALLHRMGIYDTINHTLARAALDHIACIPGKASASGAADRFNGLLFIGNVPSSFLGASSVKYFVTEALNITFPKLSVSDTINAISIMTDSPVLDAIIAKFSLDRAVVYLDPSNPSGEPDASLVADASRRSLLALLGALIVSTRVPHGHC